MAWLFRYSFAIDYKKTCFFIPSISCWSATNNAGPTFFSWCHFLQCEFGIAKSLDENRTQLFSEPISCQCLISKPPENFRKPEVSRAYRNGTLTWYDVSRNTSWKSKWIKVSNEDIYKYYTDWSFPWKIWSHLLKIIFCAVMMLTMLYVLKC